MKIGHTLLLILFVSGVAQAKPLYDAAPITQDMQQIVSLNSLDGASLKILRDGSPVYYQYFGNYTANTQVTSIASATKWLSALTLARLVEKGQMSWEDTIGQYIPTAPADKKNIRLRQLFSHTAGFTITENSCLSNRTIAFATCVNQVLATPLSYTPGTTFAYGGDSMQVAGYMAEIATGKKWDQIFIDEMVIPLGLQNTDFAAGSTQAGYIRVNNPRIAGGARSTANDYSSVLAMIQNDGLYQGVRFLNKATLDYMATDQAAGLVIGYTPYPEAHGYGIGQWREVVDFKGVAVQVSSPGAFGTTPWVDKRNRVAGIFLVKDQLANLRNEIFDLQDLVSVVFSTKYQIPPIQKPKPSSISHSLKNKAHR